MKRKEFLITSTLVAFSMSALGSVIKKNDVFVGDCDTTNDILGPFYRAKSPMRSDLTIKGLKG